MTIINLEAVKKLYKFDVENDPNNHKIQYIKFYTEKEVTNTTVSKEVEKVYGLKYKFQHPHAMEIHSTIHDSETPETSMFELGLSRTFPEGDAPKVDFDYFEKNPSEMEKWSYITRGLLSRRWLDTTT